ncbi:hypothetical protein DBW_3363 [Desulfuromonas sp. DDH964]|uniref:hypothetical protein n=1 Tax=Desulfuromonas sp. DDH964 TaxID=1823759 RepID=UPI00078CA337|nr:hypothetical protein [Desulfuromonas sp. DDH964]AMV73662.1 hypothetical protein DBW_3363 [Desulfuromonas sp. DDH964]
MKFFWEFFQVWRKRKTEPEPALDPATRSPVGEEFRPAAWVVGEALDQVLATTSGLAPRRDALLADYLDRAAAPVPVREQSLAAIVGHCRWHWSLLENWAATFAASQEYPHSWRRLPSLILPHQPPPQTIADAAPYLSYLEKRDCLRRFWPHGGRPPLPAEELDAAFIQEVPWGEVQALARERYDTRVAEALKLAEVERAGLFFQHLAATANSLMTFYQWQRIRPNQFLSYQLIVSCPDGEIAAQRFRDRFNRGESDALPPYFPGDPCRLQLRRLPGSGSAGA